MTLTCGVNRVIRYGHKQTLLAFRAGPAGGADTLGHSVDGGAFPSVPTSPIARHCQKTDTDHTAVGADSFTCSVLSSSVFSCTGFTTRNSVMIPTQGDLDLTVNIKSPNSQEGHEFSFLNGSYSPVTDNLTLRLMTAHKG